MRLKFKKILEELDDFVKFVKLSTGHLKNKILRYIILQIPN